MKMAIIARKGNKKEEKQILESDRKLRRRPREGEALRRTEIEIRFISR